MKVLYSLLAALLVMVSTAHAESPSYCVQVSRCVHLESAIHVYETLTAYKTARIEKLGGSYVVSVGAYPSRTKAEPLLAELKKPHPDAFIRKFTKSKIQIIRGDDPSGTKEKKKGATASAVRGEAPAKEDPPERTKVNPPSVAPGTPTAKTPAKKGAPTSPAARSIPPAKGDIAPRPMVIPPPVVGGETSPKSQGTGVKIPSVRNVHPAKPAPPVRPQVTPPPAVEEVAPTKPQDKKGTQSAPPQRRVSAKEFKQAKSKGVSQPSSENRQEPAGLSTLTAEESYQAGIQNYQDLRYDDAIAYLTRYISLSTNGNRSSAALLIMGKSFEALNRPHTALGIYGRVLEQYPQSPEASLSIIAIADIGVSYPTLTYPGFLKGAEYFRNPILGYDTVLARPLSAEMTEDALFQKGHALQKQGRLKESYDTFSQLLKQFPKSPYRKETFDALKTTTATLIDRYHKSGDYLAAAECYFKSKGKGLIVPGDTDTLLKSALSLAHLGFYDDSLGIVNTLKSGLTGKGLSEIDRTIAEIENLRATNASVRLPDDANWTLFQSGRDYLRSNNLPMAEQTLTKLKSEGGEPFWAKISDYAFTEKEWSQKYRGVVSGKP
ncbi:MAG: tetratricopeptide repeat protein [Deltaproteobacteria bacterium]|nr:tetratricopeptide repeat protein [Deltaproteobacteria bacterium]